MQAPKCRLCGKPHYGACDFAPSKSELRERIKAPAVGRPSGGLKGGLSQVPDAGLVLLNPTLTAGASTIKPQSRWNARWRASHREAYNRYQREYRRKRREAGKEP